MSRSAFAALPALLLLAGCTPPAGRVVVYSAQDEEFATGVFADFQATDRLRVQPKYDTEATKSVGLAAELETEAPHPRCDLHWNNEIIGTIRLARKGVYRPYHFPTAGDYPAWSKAKDGTWQAFAERARLIVVNTNLVPEADRPTSVLDLADPKWNGKVAMAKPQFGTTATQAACLFEVLGRDDATAFYRGLKANGVAVVAGNKQVARGVADGQFAVGVTDTDDAVLEVIAGKPVAIVFPDDRGHPKYERLGTLFIPNTLAVVKNCPNPGGAAKLADYLLSHEEKLATGGGYQFPIDPKLSAVPPHPALKARASVKRMAVDFEKAADLWDEVQAFLRSEFAR